MPRWRASRLTAETDEPFTTYYLVRPGLARHHGRAGHQWLVAGFPPGGQRRCPAAAALVYERVAEQLPLAQDIYRRLIDCRLAMKQSAEAFEAYRRCRHQLLVVLGIRPSPNTEARVANLRKL